MFGFFLSKSYKGVDYVFCNFQQHKIVPFHIAQSIVNINIIIKILQVTFNAFNSSILFTIDYTLRLMNSIVMRWFSNVPENKQIHSEVN